MNRLFPALALLLLSTVVAMAQNTQPGSQTENNNQNSPAIAIQPSGTETAADSPSQGQPHTEIVPESTAAPDPILDPGPLPNKPLSLIGGTVKKVDAIRNRVVVQPFGGGHEVAVLFDDRSHIYRNGAATTLLGIHRGDRVYVDTMTLEHTAFARSIRVETATGPVEAHGQVVRFDPSNRVVQMRENLTSQTVSFTISDRTALHKKDGVATIADFVPGALIEAVFAPGRRGGLADDVYILAVPGTSYVFLGRITNVDVRQGLLAIENESDHRNYEFHYSAAQVPEHDHLRVGAKVTVHANFDGMHYLADSIAILEAAPENNQAAR
jgi:hypothetical protein